MKTNLQIVSAFLAFIVVLAFAENKTFDVDAVIENARTQIKREIMEQMTEGATSYKFAPRKFTEA